MTAACFFFDGILVNFVLQELGECSFILQFITALTICDRFARKHSLVTLFSERKESRAGASKVTSNKSHNSQSLPLDKNRILRSSFHLFSGNSKFTFFSLALPFPWSVKRSEISKREKESEDFFFYGKGIAKKSYCKAILRVYQFFAPSASSSFLWSFMRGRRGKSSIEWGDLESSLSLSCSWRHVSRNDVDGRDICILLPPWRIQQDKSALICLSFCFCMLHACMQ